MKHILVAGASGKLGQLVVQELLRHTFQVRTLTRQPLQQTYDGSAVIDAVVGDLTDVQSLQTVCNKIDIVISCAGASMNIKNMRDRSTFTAVDYYGNGNLLTVAKAAGVKKFIYVSAADAEAHTQVEYFRSHWQFEKLLAASGMEHTIIQPSGMFYFMGEILAMAKNGRGFVIGRGRSKTNPVHEQDVAEACVDAISSTDRHIVAGGPDIFTRREIVELAFAIAERTPSIVSVPKSVFSLAIWPLKIINPRLYALLELGAIVSTTDAVVNKYGKRRLKEYFQTMV